jgi:hypothetical protein
MKDLRSITAALILDRSTWKERRRENTSRQGEKQSGRKI